jgi:hypothetical protein
VDTKKHRGKGKVQHATKKKCCILGTLNKSNTKEGRGETSNKWKKTLHAWSSRHKRHIIHHQRPTLAQARNIKIRMFLKKFKILKPKPTCTLKGSTILYTRSLTIVTLGKTSCKTTNRPIAKMNVKQALSFTIDSYPNNKREMREEKKNLGLGFKEANITFRV